MSFDELKKQLKTLEATDRRRELVPRDTRGTMIIEADGRELINFGGNDYLGLASQQYALQTKSGSTASALVCGWTADHQRLADALANLEGTEAAVLFPTGYAACSGTVATLAEVDDLILSDQLNHASLIDGCRLSRAYCVVYPHRNLEFVEKTLKSRRANVARAWIVTDGVFSMDGHVAPLRELCTLAEKYDAILIVDEAHGTGVLGQNGSGVCEALGVKKHVPIRIGTLSKAIGGQGGFVAGPQVVIDYLINRCRSLIYSTSLAPPAVQAGLDGLKAIAAQPQRREHLAEISRLVRQRLSIVCNDVEARVPIIPLVVGEDHEAVRRSARLRESGFFVPAIRPPTVPAGTARLRISLTAIHDLNSVESLIKHLI